jgi:hypothetical protein
MRHKICFDRRCPACGRVEASERIQRALSRHQAVHVPIFLARHLVRHHVEARLKDGSQSESFIFSTLEAHGLASKKRTSEKNHFLNENGCCFVRGGSSVEE